MFTYKEKTGFTYNGRHSDEFNIMNISTDGGMFEENLVSTRTVTDVYLTGNKITLFNGVEREPFSFELRLAFKDKFNQILADQVIEWLYSSSYYRPLQFDGTDRVVYVMPDGDSTITHTGFEEGYITLTMKSNSPFTFGYIKDVKTTVGVSKDVIIQGNDNPEIKIEISVKKAGSFKIVVNDYTLQLNNALANETISIYPETEEIESNIDNVFHYSDYIGDLSKLNFKRGTLSLIHI